MKRSRPCGVAEREGQRLARDVKVAGRAVERRERYLLGDLVEAARERHSRGWQGSRTGVRLVRRAAESKRGDDEGKRGSDGAGDEGPPAQSSTLRRARPIGMSAGEAEARGDQERGAEGVRRGAVELVLKRRLQRDRAGALLGIGRKGLERRRDDGHLPLLGSQLVVEPRWRDRP